MDKLTAMNVFCAVVEMRTFSGAARKLGISTTATSRHVQQLEQQLGAILLQRSTRHLTVTPSGCEYYEHCCEILEKILHIEGSIRAQENGVGGIVRISMPHTFGQCIISPILLDFCREYPQIILDIEFSDQSIDLVQEGIDIAIRISRTLNPGLVARELCRTRLVCCASPAYLEKHGTPRHPSELHEHACLTYSYAGFRNNWQFRKDDEVISVTVSGGLRANSGEMLKTAACCDQGVTLLPEFHVEEALRKGLLLPVLSAYDLEDYAAFVVYRPSSRRIRKTKLLVDYLCSRFADRAQ